MRRLAPVLRPRAQIWELSFTFVVYRKGVARRVRLLLNPNLYSRSNSFQVAAFSANFPEAALYVSASST